MGKTICIWGDSIVRGRGLSIENARVHLLRQHIEKENKIYTHVYDLGIDGETTVGVCERFL